MGGNSKILRASSQQEKLGTTIRKEEKLDYPCSKRKSKKGGLQGQSKGDRERQVRATEYKGLPSRKNIGGRRGDG